MHLQIILETSGYIRRVHIHFQIQQGENDTVIKNRRCLFFMNCGIIKNH